MVFRLKSSSASLLVSTRAICDPTNPSSPPPTVCPQRLPQICSTEWYPCTAGWHFDPFFTEHDEQWNPTYEEQSGQQALRTRLILNEIFAEDPSTFISITGHGGTISGFFTAVGHRIFGVQTGGFVPVIVS